MKTSGDSYPPVLTNTDANTATPSTPPTSRIAFDAPEALPSSRRPTALRTMLATGAKNIPIPIPDRMNGPTSSVYATSAVDTAAIQPRPIACSASPPARNGRPPIRSDSAPAIGATTIGIAVHGSTRRPDSSGE